VTAVTDLECRGISVWEFKPLVMDNPGLAWQLLQSLARRLRDHHPALDVDRVDTSRR
jgi:CRP-like cAMP-binding protein